MNTCKILVINLDNAEARLSNIDRQLKNLGLTWQRVPAICGNKLSDTEKLVFFSSDGYRRKHGKTANVRELGCYLSHLEAMKIFLQTQNEHALILEDDIILGNDLLAAMNSLIQSKTDWDMVKLSGIHSGTPKSIERLTKHHQLCIMLSKCTGASAYMVNRRAAQVYLENLLPMELPYDHAFDRGWALNLRIRKIHPFVCTHSYEQGSSIDIAPPPGKNTDSIKLPWHQRLHTYRYRISNEVSRLTSGLRSYLQYKLTTPKQPKNNHI